jgi:catechol 2,3-dioxygenase-like lactoylglutathione lyase family enzyme
MNVERGEKPRVIHFEISADNPQRATKFYTEVFDWKFVMFPPMDYWLATTGPEKEPGIDGAVQPRTEFKAPVINTISVSSFEGINPKFKRPAVRQFRRNRAFRESGTSDISWTQKATHSAFWSQLRCQVIPGGEHNPVA